MMLFVHELSLQNNSSMYECVKGCVYDFKYKVVQIWPGLFVCKSGDISPGHIWTTLYYHPNKWNMLKNTMAVHLNVQSCNNWI